MLSELPGRQTWEYMDFCNTGLPIKYWYFYVARRHIRIYWRLHILRLVVCHLHVYICTISSWLKVHFVDLKLNPPVYNMYPEKIRTFCCCYKISFTFLSIKVYDHWSLTSVCVFQTLLTGHPFFFFFEQTRQPFIKAFLHAILHSCQQTQHPKTFDFPCVSNKLLFALYETNHLWIKTPSAAVIPGRIALFAYRKWYKPLNCPHLSAVKCRNIDVEIWT